MIMTVALRRLALLLGLTFVLCAAGAARAGQPDLAPAALKAALIAADLPADTLPPVPGRGEAPPLWELEGTRVQQMLPYREQGSWVRITARALPAKALLIVEGQV